MLVKYNESTNEKAFQIHQEQTLREKAAAVRCSHVLHHAGNRYRIKVHGLEDAAQVAEAVNRLPAGDHRIRNLRASALTGNVTVLIRGVIAEKTLLRTIDRQLAAALRLVRQAAGEGAVFFSHDDDRQGQSSHVRRLRNATPWHNLPVEDAISRLASDPDSGLDDAMADQRRKTTGPNEFDLRMQIDRMQLLKEQMASVPNAVLAGSAFLSLISGGLIDAVFVGAVIAFNAAVGYKTSLAAEISIKSLGAHAREPVRVLRGGRWSGRDPSELVPGDIVKLQSGTVPADCALIQANGLTADESSLTGESTNVSKYPGPLPATTPMADRSNMLYAGTVITGGNATAVITATGLQTELGRVKQLTAREKMRPPLLQKQLDQLGRDSVRNTAVACGCYLLAGLARGIPFSEMLKSSASLAVAAIPEGLTAVGTVSFANGIDRMRQRGIYSRDLRAIEAIGCTHYLCLDKTGTLTSNDMVAEKIYFDFALHDLSDITADAEQGSALSKAATIAALCNDARKTGGNDKPEKYEGSSTEIALYKFAEKILGDIREVRIAHHRTDTVYRSTQRRYMVTRFSDGGNVGFEAMKGDPNAVIDRCTHRVASGSHKPMTDSDRAKIHAANTGLSRDGFRVLALAFRDDTNETEGDLVFAGLIALKNPVRSGVDGLIAGLRKAGIQPVLITGDQIETAVSIAKELGFNGAFTLRAIDATTLRGMSEQEREQEVRSTQVFARVSPEEKLEIVRLLQKDGSVVTMTGDGINDSPALRAADVGVAMGGSGTAAARDTADLVISDDDLNHLLQAIIEGRTIRRNLEHVTRFMLATNYCETAITVAATLLSGRCSLSPLQLLWINTITDVFPALAMVSRKPDAALLAENGVSPDASFFTEDQLKIILRDAALMAVAPALLLSAGKQDGRVTAGLTALVTSQMAYATGVESLSPARNGNRRGFDWLGSTALASVAVQTILPLTPVGRVLGIGRISPVRTFAAAALGAVPAFICHGDFFRQQNISDNDQKKNGGLEHV